MGKESKKRREITLLESKAIIDLAYILKKIVVDLDGLDPVTYGQSNPRQLKEWFESLGFDSIKSDVGLLTRRAN